MPNKKHEPGELIVIGGHEEKDGASEILKVVVERAGGGTLLVATLASEIGQELWQEYRKVFHKLGVKQLEQLDIETRAEAAGDRRAAQIKEAGAIFFTGGDQLRITSSFGGSRLCDLMRERHAEGLPIAGTSAGASVMSGTMLVEGPAEESHRVGDALRMAPGLGLLPEFVIDQHFAQRGRLSRLLGAVAQNPRLIGVGIDENTAIVGRPGERFDVIGDGAVYVVNGQGITYTNLSESQTDATISVHGVRLDVLSSGDCFDIEKRAAVHS
jgi:cyanophycinase